MTGPDHTDSRQHLHGWPTPERLASHFDDDPGCDSCGTCYGCDGCADPDNPIDEARGDCESCGACGECITECADARKHLAATRADALGYDLALVPRQPATGETT